MFWWKVQCTINTHLAHKKIFQPYENEKLNVWVREKQAENVYFRENTPRVEIYFYMTVEKKKLYRVAIIFVMNF